MPARLIALMSSLFFVCPALSYAETSQQKLARIDAEIAAAEQQKKDGLKIMAAGVGAQIVGWAAFFPETELDSNFNFKEKGNETLWQVAIWGGLGAEIWGVYHYWDGAQTAAQLKAKRYDISLRPEIKMEPSGDARVALALKVKF